MATCSISCTDWLFISWDVSPMLFFPADTTMPSEHFLLMPINYLLFFFCKVKQGSRDNPNLVWGPTSCVQFCSSSWGRDGFKGFDFFFLPWPWFPVETLPICPPLLHNVCFHGSFVINLFVYLLRLRLLLVIMQVVMCAPLCRCNKYRRLEQGKKLQHEIREVKRDARTRETTGRPFEVGGLAARTGCCLKSCSWTFINRINRNRQDGVRHDPD